MKIFTLPAKFKNYRLFLLRSNVKLLIKILSSIVLITISLNIAFANKETERFVIFGDSLSDSGSRLSSQLLKKQDKKSSINTNFRSVQQTRLVGNNYWIMPAGIETFKDFTGAPVTSFDYKDKKSFGKTWVNYMIDNGDTQLLNYRAIAADPAKYINNPKYSILFASASAQSGYEFVNDLDPAFNFEGAPAPYISCSNEQYNTEVSSSMACVPNAVTQVNKFLDLSKHADNANYKNTKFIIWIGGNDVNGNIAKIFNIGKLDYKKIISQLKAYHPSLLVNNIRTSIELLRDSGVPAKNIYVFGLPNFKYVPAVRSLISSFSDTNQSIILGLLSAVSINYNNSMKKLVIKEGVNFYDVGKLFIEIIKTPETFIDYYDALATDNPLYFCTNTIDNPLNNTDNNFPLCKGFVFYNNIHPTTYTHKIIADDFEKELSSKKES